MQDARFDFNAVMELTNSSTISASARPMLSAGKYSLWTSGGIATTIILADHSAARSYDIGFDSNRSFRPVRFPLLLLLIYFPNVALFFPF